MISLGGGALSTGCSEPSGQEVKDDDGVDRAETSPEWISLGRYLFYERRLSLNDNRSCGICHEQAKGFTDGFVRAVGTTEEVHPRNTQSLINVITRDALGWTDAEPSALEDQLFIPLTGDHPIEMGLGRILDERLRSLSDDPTYQRLLTPLGLDQLSPDTISTAIAHFERTITSYNAPYDLYLQGDADALTHEAKRGLALFESMSCAQCHGGRDFDQPTAQALTSTLGDPTHSESFANSDGLTEQMRHGWFNTGLYNLGTGHYPAGREGLYERSGDARDIGKYRVPTLRNLAFTAPYYHDGSGASLADVLANYNAGGRVTRSGPYTGDGREHPNKHPLINALGLTPDELRALEVFLLTLSDQSIISRQELSDPWTRDD